MTAPSAPPRPTTGESATGRRASRRRRLRRAVLAVIAALVLVGAGGYLFLRATSSVTEAGVARCADAPVSGASADPDAVAEVCGVVDGLVDAWAAHDAAAYGSAFTAGATYTTFAGTHYVGRQDIVDSHAALFDGVLGETRLHHSYLAMEFVTSDVVVLTVRGDTYEGEQPGTPTKIQTYTLVHEDGRWSVAAFQNTQRQPVMERVQFLWMPETVPAAEH
ncbi:SgcJ/EcaC family oxidoreductase [Brachybacterium sp. YJGR34]|uniref:SgcJ/EcaC family oxidoreductase n=1 Tax=Brachybacterium sp. YJGR34 TaxID=2059911 RepID=UPI000E0C6F5D|nr:SgcJ/EcaC family oxidoreductase [Brachybacterium sp. YJGR34]